MDLTGYQVAAIWQDAKEIFGTCADNVLLRLISESAEVLSNSGDFDLLQGFLDICVDGCIVTLPREVGTIQKVNIGGKPALAQDQLFNFHLNGPGDCPLDCEWSWQDLGLRPSYRELVRPSKLVARVLNQHDQGKELWAYGYDTANNWIRTEENGTMVNGYRVPTIYGWSVPDANAPVFARVTRWRKAITESSIQAFSFDASATTGTFLGNFQWDETDPQYRQIKLKYPCPWIRIAFRRRTPLFYEQSDWIPLPSRAALKQMFEATKYYKEGDLARGSGHEATARRWLTEACWVQNVPANYPIEVNTRAGVMDQNDHID